MTTNETTDMHMGPCSKFDTCIQGVIGGVGSLIIIVILVTVTVSVAVAVYKKRVKKAGRKFHKFGLYRLSHKIIIITNISQMSRKKLTMKPSSKLHKAIIPA